MLSRKLPLVRGLLLLSSLEIVCLGNLPNRYRSFKRISRPDLRKLARLALDDLRALFVRRPNCRRYQNRLLMICLCQGAAQHYVYGDRGIADFDVWAFFRGLPKEFPPRRHGRKDFGPSKFGRDAKGPKRFIGRRVDILGRSIKVRRTDTPAKAVHRYFEEPKTTSARFLAVEPAIVIWPPRYCGEVLWNPHHKQSPQ
jgi:hypothetical protein